jgi:hypothetical protein
VWHEGEEKCIQGFGGESEGNIHFEDLTLDGMIILK